MRLILSVGGMIVLLLLIAGCGGSPETLQATKTGDIPDWYPNAPQEALYVRAANTAVSQDLQVAVDKASTGARAELGRILDTKVNALQKRFEEETGTAEDATLLQQFTQATKLVVSTNMNGSKMKDQRTVRDGNNWRAYVLMELPIGAANAQLMDEIKKNKELYTRFRASEVYKELDTEVQKYEEWKKAQKE
ncbi:MAG TPA: hypothetical protein VLT13_07240 [Bacteroidota bacterium]|nr:hypothetical protein [Bacteroidota bacterium]